MEENESSSPKPPESIKDVRADYFKEISEFARSEINWVRSAYKYTISLVALVAAVGIMFTYKSTSDFKKDTKEEVERQISQMAREVRLRVDEEFKKENIHNLVEEKARTRIDEIADVLIEKQVSDKVAPRIRSAEERLDNIQGNLENATDEINKLSLLSELTATTIDAQNNDRKALLSG